MYPDVIYQMSSGNRPQGDAITIVDSFRASGQVSRSVAVDYSGYAYFLSGKLMPQFIFRVSGY